MEYFKANDEFAVRDYEDEVLKQQELKDSFTHFARVFLEPRLRYGEPKLFSELIEL